MILDIGLGLFILYQVIQIIADTRKEIFFKIYNITSENEGGMIGILNDTIIKFGLSEDSMKLKKNKMGYQIIF